MVKFGQNRGEIWIKVIKFEQILLYIGQNQNLASKDIRFPYTALLKNMGIW